MLSYRSSILKPPFIFHEEIPIFSSCSYGCQPLAKYLEVYTQIQPRQEASFSLAASQPHSTELRNTTFYKPPRYVCSLHQISCKRDETNNIHLVLGIVGYYTSTYQYNNQNTEYRGYLTSNPNIHSAPASTLPPVCTLHSYSFTPSLHL